MNTHNTQAQRLLEVLRLGLDGTRAQASAELGDRSRYIGLTDLATFVECPRAAIAKRVQPQAPLPLEQLLALNRGHWAEEGMQKTFAACGFNLLTQLEVSLDTKPLPVKAHLDFVLVSDQPRATVRILEMKSLSKLPDDKPYAAYDFQAQSQVTLLQKLWDKPVFQATNLGPLSFPELVKKQFRIALPVKASQADIQSWLLCLAPGEARPYGPYTFQQHNFEEIKRLAQGFSTFLKSRLEDVPVTEGFSVRCAYCEFAAQCPKFTGTDQPEWEDLLNRLDQLKRARDKSEEDIAEIEAGLKQGYTNCKLHGDWIMAGSYRFRVTNQPGRLSLDKQLLQNTLSSLIGDSQAGELLAKSQKQSLPYKRLWVSKIPADDQARAAFIIAR